MEDKVPVIMESVFECTLEMINKDFSEYPEHRVEFFKLLKAINLYCFQALLKLDSRQFKFVIDSCLWASKHDNREVENTGLTMCMELVDNMAETDPNTSGLFFRSFYITILQDVFFVLTDTDHKAGEFYFLAKWVLAIVATFQLIKNIKCRLQNAVTTSFKVVPTCRERQNTGADISPRSGPAGDHKQGFPPWLCGQSPNHSFQQPSTVSLYL